MNCRKHRDALHAGSSGKCSKQTALLYGPPVSLMCREFGFNTGKVNLSGICISRCINEAGGRGEEGSGGGDEGGSSPTQSAMLADQEMAALDIKNCVHHLWMVFTMHKDWAHSCMLPCTAEPSPPPSPSFSLPPHPPQDRALLCGGHIAWRWTHS